MPKQIISSPEPPVLRSRRELMARGVSFLSRGAAAPTALPITADGATYSMAQEIAWIDGNHFAVGRWDGSLSVFEYNPSSFGGPLINAAVSNPSMEGVQMVQWLARRVFATSNDEGSMLVWRSRDGSWRDLRRAATLAYDPALGVANSADSLRVGTKLYLVAGHANGYVTIWSKQPTGVDFDLVATADVRSPNPTNPWGLHNVRGVAVFHCTDQAGYVVTGSEDGNLCVVRVPDGAILSTTVYNPQAQRGINSVSTLGQDLLVANCSVGPDDKNLWYYRIDLDDWSITVRDSENLKVNPDAPQVFNFCTIWARYTQGICFFASTEEGALWMGTVANDQSLSIIGYQEVTSPLGSALAFNARGRLALVSYDLYEFITMSGAVPPASENPERLTI
ncbi:MAG: hypothetical protein IT372_19470 [Polyangiaceae bacterium]|nr:hypothetical protein [Polyangiaceae bacterium]